MGALNWLDLSILLVLGYLTLKGFWRGLVREVLDLAGVVLLMGLGFHYAAAVGEALRARWGAYLHLADSFWILVGFLAIAAGVALLIALVNQLWDMMAELAPLSLLNRLAGAAFGLVKGALIVTLLVWVLARLPLAAAQQALATSRLAPTFLAAAPLLSGELERLVPQVSPPRTSPRQTFPPASPNRSLPLWEGLRREEL
ncbi:MAG: CvpA family protein [Bacillota bacterium]|nr:CvpA family protein [Bacillota bacterium]